MIGFCTAEETACELGMCVRMVKDLAREKQLSVREDASGSGTYLFHPVDISRFKLIRYLIERQQDSLKPDIVWVERACRLLTTCITRSGFDPQRIVGIASGGLIPASFLSVFLQRPLYMLGVSHYNGRAKLPQPVITVELESFPDVPTLVVDDLVDSGGTMDLVEGYLRSHGVSDVHFATLHKKPVSSFEPDWYVDVVDGWVHYPWEDE